MRKFLFLFLIVSSCLSSQTYNSPESVEYDYSTRQWFVSNNGNGQILKRNPSGVLSVFASGIPSGPHGLEIVGDTIYACDGGTIKGYNLNTGAQVMNLNLGASFLNGLTNDGGNFLYATDFSGKKIYKIDRFASTFTSIATTTKTPNGIIYDGANNRCVFVTWGASAAIQAIDLSTFAVTTLVTTSFSNIDGIARDGQGNYFISPWGNNSIQKYNSNFTVGPTSVTTGLSSPADIMYNTLGDTLAIPNSGTANNVVFLGFNTIGIQNISSSQESFSTPNPVQDICNINFTLSKPQNINCSFYDLTGKLIFSQIFSDLQKGLNAKTIDLSGFEQGMYVLKIEGETIKGQKQIFVSK